VAAAALTIVPAAALAAPGVAIADPTSPTGWAASAAQTLGEEVLFRGLIAGVLVRRWGFARGNAVQALVFLLPHLLLLAVDARLWPLVVAQLVAGWLLGWLRHRSGSVLPGWLAHTAANLLAPVLVGG
jgi:membrane protease YdiL (CAAX protease family)